MSSFILFGLYNLIILPLLYLLSQFASLFDEKVAEGLAGRKRIWSDLDDFDRSEGKLIWVHCASLGEFEQARPLLKELKLKLPDIQVVVTFFSPSGYVRADSEFVDLKLFLPIDWPYTIKKFLRILEPDCYIIVSYDVWPNTVQKCFKQDIPVIIMSARLPESSLRFKFYSIPLQKPIYRLFHKVLTISEQDAERFVKIGVMEEAIMVVGNTRYDQVWSRIGDRVPKATEFVNFSRERRVLICGSIWRSDFVPIIDNLVKIMKSHPDLAVVLVPHEPEEKFTNDISSTLEANGISFVLFSKLNTDNTGRRVILIDEVGFLAGLYRFGHVVFIGGGFGPGVHNVIEPAAYNIPVIFGPKMRNSHAAELMVESEGGFIVNDGNEYASILIKMLTEESYRVMSGERAGRVVRENLGATERIISVIEAFVK